MYSVLYTVCVVPEVRITAVVCMGSDLECPHSKPLGFIEPTQRAKIALTVRSPQSAVHSVAAEGGSACLMLLRSNVSRTVTASYRLSLSDPETHTRAHTLCVLLLLYNTAVECSACMDHRRLTATSINSSSRKWASHRRRPGFLMHVGCQHQHQHHQPKANHGTVTFSKTTHRPIMNEFDPVSIDCDDARLKADRRCTLPFIIPLPPLLDDEWALYV